MSQANPLRVLIIEDDDSLRESVSLVLQSPTRGTTLAGAFPRAQPALAAVRGGLQFDVALIDLGLPDLSGVDVIGVLTKERPGIPLLAFTVFDDAPNVFGALRTGARGYVLKGANPDQVIASLHEAHRGGSPLSGAVARLVVDAMVDHNREAQVSASLTTREKDVLVLLSKGMGYGEIGELLGLQLGTVQGYIKTIYRKLSVSSKAEAAAVAAKLGLV